MQANLAPGRRSQSCSAGLVGHAAAAGGPADPAASCSAAGFEGQRQEPSLLAARPVHLLVSLAWCMSFQSWQLGIHTATQLLLEALLTLLHPASPLASRASVRSYCFWQHGLFTCCCTPLGCLDRKMAHKCCCWKLCCPCCGQCCCTQSGPASGATTSGSTGEELYARASTAAV